MNHKKILGGLLALSVIGILVGFFLTDPLAFGLCRSDYLYVFDGVERCRDPIADILGQPLLFGFMPLLIVFLILLFLPQPYFKNWLKYAAWYIPVGALWIIASDVTCGGGLGLGMCFDKELATWWSSGIYLVLSLIVIAIAFFKRRS